MTAKVFSAAGIEPRISSVLPASCANANIGDPTQCHAVNGGLDIGSLAPGSAPGNPYVAGNPLVGGGLDGIPDIQFVRLNNLTQFRGDQYNARLDFNPTNNDKIAVSGYFTPSKNTGSDTAGRARPMADITSPRFNWSVAGIYDRVINARMFNEARININGWRYNEVTANADTNFGIPRIEVEGYNFDRIRFGADRSEGTPGIFNEKALDLRDTFNWVIGNQNLKIGAEFRKELNNNSLIGGARPLYSFTGLWNLANDAPVFESINFDPSTGGPATGERQFSSNNYALFVQDDWKFRRNLTVNLGLRWEFFSPLKDKTGQQSNFFYGPNGVVDGTVRPVDNLVKSDFNNFGPQVGFAYSPKMLKDKGVIRGGFGMGYNRLPNAIFLNSRGNPPFFARGGECCGTAGSPFAGGTILYATGTGLTGYPANPVLGQGIDPNTGFPIGGAVEIYGGPQDMPTSYVYRYSLEAQYELPYKLIGTLGYQGSAGRHFVRLVDQNLIFASGANPHATAIFFAEPDVNTNYNGLNAVIERRFANGLQFGVNYRYSKSLDNLSYEGPGFVTNQTFPPDNSSEYGPSDYDVRNYWVASALWDIPFFNKGNGWKNKVLGGWEINGIWTYHTGFPWTPKIGPGLRGPSGNFFGPIRPVAYLGGTPLANTNDNFLTTGIFPNGGAAYFRTSLNPGDPTYLNNPPGVGRNVFRGPKYRALDISVVKRFRLGGVWKLKEGAGLDLRANFFNIFNQLNLANFGFGDDNTFVDRSQFGKALNALAGRTAELQIRFNF